ncbi:MAG: RagB/SusD family nutrient uptake outer membrane protein [Bacteroidota bacterium]
MNNKPIKLIKLTLLSMIVLMVSTCVKLEEDLSGILSAGNIITESDAMSALAPAYRAYQSAYQQSHRMRTATYGSDDLTAWWGGNKQPFRNFDTFNYGSGENSDHAWHQDPWDKYWRTIYRTNSVLNALAESTADPELVATAQGEARFMRALAYLVLVRTWGNMPVILDGVIPTGEEDRETVLANYGHIEADLLFAEANLPGPDEVTNVGRASSAAASAALADLYLTWAGWPVKDESKYAAAAQKAKAVIDLGYFELLPFDELWLQENQNSRESIFSVQFSEAEDNRNIAPQNFHFHEAGGWSDAYPERQFFLDFPEGLRKEITFHDSIPQRVTRNGQVVELGFSVHWTDSQRKHPMYRKFNLAERLDLAGKLAGYRAVEVYRYAEVLLIYAEAQLRSGGQTAESLEALNQVKRRAMGLPYDVPDSGVDVVSATADEIIAEKGWELAGEHKRWFDLVRSEKIEEVTLRRDPTEEVALVRQPTRDNYIAPIPAQAINTSIMMQNPEGFRIQ